MREYLIVAAPTSMATINQVRDYWNQHIHDLDISTHQPGTREFFDDLDQYHFEKLHHLPRLIDFDAWRGSRREARSSAASTSRRRPSCWRNRISRSTGCRGTCARRTASACRSTPT